MLVHFIASRGELNNDMKYFLKIRNAIQAKGAQFALDWITPTHQLMEKGEYDSVLQEVDWKKINQQNQDALNRCDVVIAEASARSFSTGFQVANAIQQKKPVLILTRNNTLSGTFASGLTSDFVRDEQYNLDSLEKIIGDFIESNMLESKDMRFNFFIDRKIYNYLRWASFKTGKTKAEILRDLVNKEIDKNEY